jgi:glycine/D-amino acid oxidase-like deaminating enzyme
VKYRWAAQDCMSLDGMPYIGRYSKRTEGLYTATGFNKWGMTGSMVAARLLTDLLTGRENPCEALLSPSRSILHPQLAVNGLEAMGNLLIPTKKRCPHLGCALKWNGAEHSWDCACHGSRFSQEGQRLDGPATGNLKK